MHPEIYKIMVKYYHSIINKYTIDIIRSDIINCLDGLGIIFLHNEVSIWQDDKNLNRINADFTLNINNQLIQKYPEYYV